MNRLGARLRRIAMASTALVALPMIAAAQDATWVGPGFGLGAAANWSPQIVPQGGVGTFNGTGPVTPQIVSNALDFGSFVFTAGAPSHTIAVNNSVLTFNGAGIVNNSGNAQIFVLERPGGAPAQIIFRASASAGTAIIRSASATDLGDVFLVGNSNGGNAQFENVFLEIGDSASAGTLTLAGGRVQVSGQATLGAATLLLSPGQTSAVVEQASLGAARITILDGHSLRMRQDATGGTAAITVLGQGQFDLTGLNAGRAVTLGSLAGDGRVVFGTQRGSLIIDGPGGTFAGRFEGGGTQSGVTFRTGTYVLTGTSPFVGIYVVSAGGTLLVDGDIRTARDLIVAAAGSLGPGGTLGGTGTVGTAVIGGTLSPGRSIGTLSVAGDLRLQSTATTIIELDPASGATDRVNVTGTATIAGGLQVVRLGAALPTNGQVFTIIQAGSVTGTYGTVTVTNPLAYFDFAPVYTANQVNLVATQLPFNNPAATQDVRNLVQKSNALDAYVAAGAGNADFNAVLLELLRSPTAAQATAALHSMSGEAYASFTTVGLEQMDRFRYAALDAAGSCEGRGGEMRGRWCAWADAYYVSASLDGSGDLAGFDYTLSGVQGGVETRLRPDAVVGFTLGYGNQRMRNFDFASRRITGDALFAGVYGTYGMGPWQVAGLLGYSHFDVDGERDIAVGSIGRQARSNFGADGVNAAMALRYRADLGGFRIEPEALLAFSQYWQDSFTETGAGSLNLRVGGSDANSFVTGIGVRASTEFAIEGRMVRPFAVLRYEHDWLAGEKEDHRITAAFAQVPEAGSWTVFGQNRGRENVIGRLGVVGEITSNVALFGTVGGQLNSNGSEWGVGGGVRVTF